MGSKIHDRQTWKSGGNTAARDRFDASARQLDEPVWLDRLAVTTIHGWQTPTHPERDNES
jgi:hypothetical protein